VAIGLGANLGRPLATFRRALSVLEGTLQSPRTSAVYRTSPVGGPAQPDYWNAAVSGTTRLGPTEILAVLRRLEREAGRVRGCPRNTPRPLDLDLLLYGNRRVRRKGLTVPHPRLVSRLFVLVPLADLAPGRVVPGTGKRVATLLAEARAVSPERVVRIAPAGALFASRPSRAARRGAGRPRA
jgi:2-amino-4-hydroxy-6-hydroxymethyldihydropteridine diphosphokinase